MPLTDSVSVPSSEALAVIAVPPALEAWGAKSMVTLSSTGSRRRSVICKRRLPRAIAAKSNRRCSVWKNEKPGKTRRGPPPCVGLQKSDRRVNDKAAKRGPTASGCLVLLPLVRRLDQRHNFPAGRQLMLMTQRKKCPLHKHNLRPTAGTLVDSELVVLLSRFGHD